MYQLMIATVTSRWTSAGPENHVGPRNKVGAGNKVMPATNICVYICIYIYKYILVLHIDWGINRQYDWQIKWYAQ